ncbi:hypothetical protein [Endozoicomonas lisbonensis]|uniref:Uncharacterized protein n=1 Tax=Endozoicomonas lisbonensis TaxID=3120522 RepID=A0ABV2SM02_9GAMM
MDKIIKPLSPLPGVAAVELAPKETPSKESAAGVVVVTVNKTFLSGEAQPGYHHEEISSAVRQKRLASQLSWKEKVKETEGLKNEVGKEVYEKIYEKTKLDFNGCVPFDNAFVRNSFDYYISKSMHKDIFGEYESKLDSLANVLCHESHNVKKEAAQCLKENINDVEIKKLLILRGKILNRHSNFVRRSVVKMLQDKDFLEECRKIIPEESTTKESAFSDKKNQLFAEAKKTLLQKGREPDATPVARKVRKTRGKARAPKQEAPEKRSGFQPIAPKPPGALVYLLPADDNPKDAGGCSFWSVPSDEATKPETPEESHQQQEETLIVLEEGDIPDQSEHPLSILVSELVASGPELSLQQESAVAAEGRFSETESTSLLAGQHDDGSSHDIAGVAEKEKWLNQAAKMFEEEKAERKRQLAILMDDLTSPD